MNLTKIIIVTAVVMLLPLAVCAENRKIDFVDPITGIEFILVKGGEFDMGDIRGKGYDIERPAHKVAIQDFYMSITEITFSQYGVYLKESKRREPDDEGWGRGNRPVINISWNDAMAFSRWLSKKGKKTYRLPTEAEWEYAARAGRNSEFWWGDTVGKNNANCHDCGSDWSGKSTSPVASFAASPYGLYDMNGNVYEWCLDTRHDNYQGAPKDGSAWLGGDYETQKIARSGSFLLPSFESRARARSWDLQSRSGREYGIRLVMEP